MGEPSSQLVAVDGHVHLYETPLRAETLRSSVTRLVSAAPSASVGCLLLADRAGQNQFEALRPSLLPTSEPFGGWLPDAALPTLIIAGRQVAAAERIEVLGFGTLIQVEDGHPAEAVVERFLAADALVVLPWGVGKWLGRRGKVVARLLDRYRGRIAVGDIARRPRLWPLPADGRHHAILAGSDPLPLPGQVEAIGEFGSLVQVPALGQAPATDLKHALSNPATTSLTFGRRAGFIRLIKDQLDLRHAQEWRPPSP